MYGSKPYFIIKFHMSCDNLQHPSAFVSQKQTDVATSITEIHAFFTDLTGNLLSLQLKNK